MGTRTISKGAASAYRGTFLEMMGAHLNQLVCALLSDPGLRIKGATASPTVENENAFHAVVAETLLTVAATTDMAALVGTVSNGEFGIWFFYVDASGTLTVSTLATAASLAAITLPAHPDDKACVGAVLVNPTGTGDFVGGTTNLDDGTVVPNAVFFDGNDFPLANRIEFHETGAPASTI